MKKFGIYIVLALFGLFVFAGCSAVTETGERAETDAGTGSQWQQNDPEQDGPNTGDDFQKHEEAPDAQHDPVISPLAFLDNIDVATAFGDREAEGWSFAMRANGDVNASCLFSLTSEISDEEKLNIECGVGLGLEDLFGIRSADENALGVELFGGGNANMSLKYRGPKEDSDELSKDLNVDFRHDGDLIWYAGERQPETAISFAELTEKIDDAAMAETLRRMENAFAMIPQELSKGVSLRFAVEKLIDLGFTLEVDDTDGVAISLKANAGFYTDLFNDMLEELIPSEWLKYLPRADLRYDKTVFDIELSFDDRGIFREYSMSSDVAMTASLEVRGLFLSESSLKVGGGLSISANASDPA